MIFVSLPSIFLCHCTIVGLGVCTRSDSDSSGDAVASPLLSESLRFRCGCRNTVFQSLYFIKFIRNLTFALVWGAQLWPRYDTQTRRYPDNLRVILLKIDIDTGTISHVRKAACPKHSRNV